ncbi:hypothetical protein M422DRAFT_54589 [Sphaerobolus stellatus SS14]|uniref:Uncharacterized protein n=1 Tax=Sphaerobolus stellatus (strain SS14) TaxID=990650 RepID=A0A0C9TGG5_SPHS4|nr:hypothetical protein M422DRAFT_54589 [Sphaerobolus stellatus SS14]
MLCFSAFSGTFSQFPISVKAVPNSDSVEPSLGAVWWFPFQDLPLCLWVIYVLRFLPFSFYLWIFITGKHSPFVALKWHLFFKHLLSASIVKVRLMFRGASDGCMISAEAHALVSFQASGMFFFSTVTEEVKLIAPSPNTFLSSAPPQYFVFFHPKSLLSLLSLFPFTDPPFPLSILILLLISSFNQIHLTSSMTTSADDPNSKSTMGQGGSFHRSPFPYPMPENKMFEKIEACEQFETSVFAEGAFRFQRLLECIFDITGHSQDKPQPSGSISHEGTSLIFHLHHKFSYTQSTTVSVLSIGPPPFVPLLPHSSSVSEAAADLANLVSEDTYSKPFDSDTNNLLNFMSFHEGSAVTDTQTSSMLPDAAQTNTPNRTSSCDTYRFNRCTTDNYTGMDCVDYKTGDESNSGWVQSRGVDSARAVVFKDDLPLN